jgi:catechol 2,3-dioxygenase-like lactoylglutathione lyase family enzyme
MRTCKEKYSDKRFFVVNTNEFEFVKLEVFPMDDPVTAHHSGAGVLQEHPGNGPTPSISGGNASVFITDMDKTVDFYVKMLGLKQKTRIGNEWAEIDAGRGLVIGLHQPHAGTKRPGDIGAINIELAVTKPLEDVLREVRAARRALTAKADGAFGQGDPYFIGEIESWPNVRLVPVSDPDRNVVTLAQVLHG